MSLPPTVSTARRRRPFSPSHVAHVAVLKKIQEAQERTVALLQKIVDQGAPPPPPPPPPPLPPVGPERWAHVAASFGPPPKGSECPECKEREGRGEEKSPMGCNLCCVYRPGWNPTRLPVGEWTDARYREAMGFPPRHPSEKNQ
jgi:hypothetical protein